MMETQGNNFSFAKTNKQITLLEKFPTMSSLSEAWHQKPRVCNSDINLFKFHSQFIKWPFLSAIQKKKTYQP